MFASLQSHFVDGVLAIVPVVKTSASNLGRSRVNRRLFNSSLTKEASVDSHDFATVQYVSADRMRLR